MREQPFLCERGRQQEYERRTTGRRYWSVSEVLHVLDPHAFDDADPYKLAQAQERGTDIHVLLGLYLLWLRKLGAKPARPSGILAPYYDAIEKFAYERKPYPEKIEDQGCNERDGVVGTVDTQARLDDQETLWTIDAKTGGPRAVHAAQLVGGYKHLSGYEQSKRFASLYLKNDGNYKFVEHTYNMVVHNWFQGGLTVLNGRKYHGVR